MGTRYEKNRKATSENKQDFERISSEKEELKNEYAMFSRLLDFDGLVDDEVQKTITDVGNVETVETLRLDEETETAEQNKTNIADSIGGELSKLQSGLEKLNSANNEFGKSSIEQAKNEYNNQIEKFNELLDELGEKSTNIEAHSIGSSEGNADAFIDISDEPIPLNDGDVIDIPHNEPNSLLISNLTQFNKISGEHSVESDLRTVNPNFTDDIDSPWHNNCQRCVMAYEARRRGYDVEALPLPSDTDRLLWEWPTVFNNSQLIDCSANSGTAAKINIEDQFESWGDNFRAIIRVSWKPSVGSGGHVFIAESNNGVVRYIDPQTGNEDASDYFNIALGSNVKCMRIDNLEFSEDINLCCSNRAR